MPEPKFYGVSRPELERKRPVSLCTLLGRHPERRGHTHERHEQHALHHALSGSVLAQRADMKRGLPLGTLLSRTAVPPSFSSLREGPWVAWMDAQYAAHPAHAYDPSVLDASLPARPYFTT